MTQNSVDLIKAGADAITATANLGSASLNYWGMIRKGKYMQKDIEIFMKLFEELAKKVREYSDLHISIDTNGQIRMENQKLNQPVITDSELRNKFIEFMKEFNFQTTVERANDISLSNGVKFDLTQIDIKWLLKYYDITSNIDDCIIKELWAKILTGENKFPGSVSLRSLEVLRNTTKEDAQIFENILKYSSFQSRVYSNELLEKVGITYKEISLMREIGLISHQDEGYEFKFNTENEVNIAFARHFINVKSNENNIQFIEKVYRFTRCGYELATTIDFEDDLEYIKQFANILIKKHPYFKISLYRIEKFYSDGRVEFDPMNLLI